MRFLRNVFTLCWAIPVLLSCTVHATAVQGCSSAGITLLPTATRPSDPNLSQPIQVVSAETPIAYCPTPIPSTTSIASPPSHFSAANVTNLSLDSADQTLLDAAIGDDMLAVAWATAGDIYVGLSRGGNHFQVRRVDVGSTATLTFSNANRLHLAYEQAGRILYRAADQGVHPANVSAETVTDGTSPQLVLDQYNYAQIVYETPLGLHAARQVMTDDWLVSPVFGINSNSHSASFARYGEDISLGYVVAYQGAGNALHLAKWDTTPYGLFATWQQVETFTIAADEALQGGVALDYLEADGTEYVVASWVTIRPNIASPLPTFAQPIIEPVNPLFPNQIANPNQIHSGLNAVRWHNDFNTPHPFSAGLYQTVSVHNRFLPVSVTAWGRGEAATSSLPLFRIGVEPSGSTNPNAASVVWSSPLAADNFMEVSISDYPSADNITVFLNAEHITTTTATTVWDSVSIENATLLNGDFEGVFTTQNGMAIPDGWTPYHADAGNAPISGRDLYTAYAAWSSDGGNTWSTPTAVIENRTAGGAISGALGQVAYPFITDETATPSVAFFYVYAVGDPPHGSDYLRFGRPHTLLCAWGMTACNQMPGRELLPRSSVSPTHKLLLERDRFNPRRALLVWNALQTDVSNKDVKATFVVLR